MNRLRILGASIVVMSLLWLGGCGGDKASSSRAGMKKVSLVEVVPAKQEAISRLVELTGEVVATNSVSISATVEGPIAFCPWREGDHVKKGEKLIEIDRPLYREEVEAAQAAVDVAQAKLEDLLAGARPEEIAQAKESVKRFEESTSFAKADMERVAQMVTSGSLKGEDLDKARVTYSTYQTQLEAAKQKLSMLEAGPTKTQINLQKATVEQAKASLGLAKAKLAETVMVAPFDGFVTKAPVRPGDTAALKSKLLELADASSLRVRFSVPEKQALLVREGGTAIVQFDAYPEKRFTAIITRRYPELDSRTRTRVVEAQVKERVELVPGMFARVSVVVETAQDAVVVPGSAILTNPRGEKIAFAVVGGKASMRKVRTGIAQGRKVQIVEGVNPGEMVVVAGNERLKDGVKVRLPKQKGQPAEKKSGGNQP